MQVESHGLVLGRKTGESVVIGLGTPQQCTVTIDRVVGGQVRLRFTAAKEVRIFREELVVRNESVIPVMEAS